MHSTARTELLLLLLLLLLGPAVVLCRAEWGVKITVVQVAYQQHLTMMRNDNRTDDLWGWLVDG